VKRNPTISVEAAGGVYAPAEDSELLLDSLDVGPGVSVLEVGTGSGFIAIHCAAAGASVTATDLDTDAAACAAANARANGACLDVVACDLASAVKGQFGLVIFNPPYLPGRMGQPAADGGEGGIDEVSRLLDDLPRLLDSGGRCVIVLSSHSDAAGLVRKHPMLSFQPLRTKRLFFEVLTSYEIVRQKSDTIK
jgi:release factor glutamine methyltransferase